METTDQKDTNEKLTEDDINMIRSKLTEDRFSILKAIYDTPRIQHKTLCERLDKSPSNISNMIRRIATIGYDLVLTSKNGTEKYYSLTPIAIQYVEHELLTSGHGHSSQNRESDQSSSAETLAAKALEMLDLFKEKCGISWRSTLYDLLTEKDITSNPEIQNIYNKLSTILYKCRMQNTDALQKIFDMLEDMEDEELIGQIRNHLDTKFLFFDLLNPLLILERPNSTASFKIIDEVFSELHPLVFTPLQHEKLSETVLTSGEYNNLMIGIIKLTSEFVKKRYSKSNAVSIWKSTYFLTEELAFYIAEKCSFLMILYRFK